MSLSERRVGQLSLAPCALAVTVVLAGGCKPRAPGAVDPTQDGATTPPSRVDSVAPPESTDENAMDGGPPRLVLDQDLNGKVEVIIPSGEHSAQFIIAPSREGLVAVELSAEPPDQSGSYEVFACPEGSFVEERCNLVEGLGVGNEITLYVRGPEGRVWVELTPEPPGIPVDFD